MVHLLLLVATLISDHSAQLLEPVHQKTSQNSSSNKSEIHIDLSLKISCLCHISSKALDMSKKTSQDSRLGCTLKAVCILRTMDNSWFTVKSLAQKPDSSAESNLCSSRYTKCKLKISLSDTFPQIGISETGQQLLIACLSPFLWIWHILDFFHISGNVLWLKQFLKMIKSDFIVAESHVFNILIDCPCVNGP